MGKVGPRVSESSLYRDFNSACRNSYPLLADVVRSIPSISELADGLAKYAQSSVATISHQDTLSRVEMLLCLVHDLLSLPRYVALPEHDSILGSQMAMREAIRLAALVVVSLIITDCVEDQVNKNLFTAGNFRGRIKASLHKSQKLEWIGLKELKLWVLVIGAVIETGDERAWFVTKIRHSMRECGLDDWDQVIRILKQVAWFDHLAARQMMLLAMDV